MIVLSDGCRGFVVLQATVTTDGPINSCQRLNVCVGVKHRSDDARNGSVQYGEFTVASDFRAGEGG